MKHTLIAAIVTLVTAGAVLAPAPSAMAAVTEYFVDCSAPSNGVGTALSPWNSTAAVNAKSGGFSAGDAILLKRGTTCVGSLAPSGSGSVGAPIRLSDWGTASARPIVDARPTGSDFGVKLSNQSYWTVDDLEIAGGKRYGIFVTSTSGLVSGVTLSNLNVHDVHGSTLNSKNTGLVVVSPTHDASNSTNARFDSILIDGVVAHDTTMWAGIIVGTGTNADSWATNQSKRSTNVTVRNSEVYNIYGDGIVLFTLNNGLVEHSVAHETGIQPTQTIGTPNGIWTWACNGCIVQYNEAYNNDSPGVDGGAFDIDYFNDNNIVQYNYGHDNSSYCIAVFGAENYATTNSIVRGNICANNGKQNVAQRSELEVSTWNGGSINGLQVYNNTFITNNVVASTPVASFTGSLARTFENNIIYATTASPRGLLDAMASDYNVWYSTAASLTGSEPHSVYADPKLVNPTHTGAGSPGTAFQLQASSPAIDAGLSELDGATDQYGTVIPQGNGPDIGSFESPFNARSLTNLLTNSGFESGSLSGWSNWPSGASVSATTPRTGSWSAKQTGSSAGVFRTVTGLSPNTSYSFSAWVKAEAGQQSYLYAKNFGATEVQSATQSATNWQQTTISFVTGASATSVEIGVWRGAGSGVGSIYLDDAVLTRSKPNLFSDAGFESGGLAGWSTSSTVAPTTTSPRSGTYALALSGSPAGMFRSVTGLAPATTYRLSAWVKSDAGQQAFLYVKNHGGATIHSLDGVATGYSLVTVTFTTGATSTSAEVGVWRESTYGSGVVCVDDMALAMY
ncbi:MAG: carbohydrate binding domain-containing protein [Microbacteriaceae bacterium]